MVPEWDRGVKRRFLLQVSPVWPVSWRFQPNTDRRWRVAAAEQIDNVRFPRSQTECRWGVVPEGHSTIARRFNAGEARKGGSRPEGTIEKSPGCQPSLRDGPALLCRTPGVETPGYSRMSLRDRGQARPSDLRPTRRFGSSELALVPKAPIPDLCRQRCRKVASSTKVATKVATKVVTKASVWRAFGTGATRASRSWGPRPNRIGYGRSR
jgi:hypothetical protein